MNTASAPSTTATAAFKESFGRDPALLATAPGRVNLIGEHTDYNDGFVFPAAINYHTAIAAAPRPDQTIAVVACDQNQARVEFSLGETAKFDSAQPWSNYVRGVVQQLQRAGYRLCGADLAISGNVPLGAGLSSSAALEIATIAALTRLSKEPIEAATAARIGQQAENEFVGVPCGIMDQLISAAGRTDHALLIDCRSLQQTPVPLPAGYELLIINSNVRHALVDGQYRARREQCETAAAHFGVAALRDVTLAQLQSAQAELPPLVYQRARHVITENQRTLELVAALQAGETSSISQLMAGSHQSMRDDFEITVPEIDALVEIVSAVTGQHGGVRMTGGGFGGSVVALLPTTLTAAVQQQVNARYPDIAGREASMFVCQPSSGAFASAPAAAL
ncbi:MAG: galactokinase [Pseudomonadales bacterium]